MRKRALGRGLLLGGLLAVARLGAGCVVSSSDDCEALGTCPETTTGTTTTTSSTTTTVPPACIDFAAGDVVSAECGLFVAPGTGSDDMGDGSQATPFATLGKALGVAQTKPVYACAGPLVESVVVKGDRVVLGGFACDSWAYTGDKPALSAAADAIAITVDEGASLTLQDFAVASVAAKKGGGSSIAMLARSLASLDLTRVDVTAGDGALGVAGVTPAQAPGDGTPGMPGGTGCSAADAQILGGTGGLTMCDGASTNGGLGGTGTLASGGDGSEGEPAGGTGVAGVGAKQNTSCKVGGQGSEGMPGGEGAGAAANGTLTADGFAGASGDPGDPGTPGQGGGGGGGAKVCANGKAGPGGGGGGAGGCGGKGGGGGGAGGSSIGIAAYSAKAITLTGGSIKTGKGGLGGAGAAGQDGGFGGPLGTAGGPGGACAGGQGGAGGPGGPGGGGAGGHSIGVVWTGTAPMATGTAYAQAGAGAGGMGGPGSAGGAGAMGAAQDTLEAK